MLYGGSKLSVLTLLYVFHSLSSVLCPLWLWLWLWPAGRGELSPAGIRATVLFLDMFTSFATTSSTDKGTDTDTESDTDTHGHAWRAQQRALLGFAYAHGLVGVVSLACLPQVRSACSGAG